MIGEAEAVALVERFHRILTAEVRDGNPSLSSGEQQALRAHYPLIAETKRTSIDVVRAVYARRRAQAVRFISAGERVLDAGCGFGSEAFLFASLGASVTAVDLDAEKIRVAEKRRAYYERTLGCSLDVRLLASDLDCYEPERELSATWISSVLAAVRDQNALLARIYRATLPGGTLTVSDMNLRNPLFLFGEWRRRWRAARSSSAFASEASFPAMVGRRSRSGARYFPLDAEGGAFDDVQFFTPSTLRTLFDDAGFRTARVAYAGCLPPIFASSQAPRAEGLLASCPVLSSFAYFYTVTGVR